MSDTAVRTDAARGCGTGAWSAGSGGGALLPVDPFYAPRYHFGMLLGVDDFEAEQAYARGKARLHAAWAHGPGVLWGYGVSVPVKRDGGLVGEIRVEPGLAYDPAGRELHLGRASCVGVAAWYAEQVEQEWEREALDGGGVRFDAHVVARHRACLGRPVPAISEPCAGSGGNDVAFSRVQETVELLLRPGRAPAHPAGHPRVRLLFGLDAPLPAGDGARLDDQDDVVTDRDAVLARPAAEQPAAWLAALRRWAAADTAALRPPGLREDGDAEAERGESTLFPVDDDRAEVVLAEVRGITLEPGEGGALRLTAVETVDLAVRPSHLSTATVQELLCGPLCCSAGAGPAPPADGGDGGDGGGDGDPVVDGDGDGGAETESGGGPRLDPATVRMQGERITVETADGARLARPSVSPENVSVTVYDRRDGWIVVDLDSVRPDRAGRKLVIRLKHRVENELVRLVVRGTGPTPVLGDHLAPLGADPGAADGRDFVHTFTRSDGSGREDT